MKLRKTIPSWENAPFDGPEKSLRGFKFRLKIEGVFFWLTNQSISGFGRFFPALQGYITSKSLLYTIIALFIALFMPIYSKGVYFLTRVILRLHSSSGD